MHSLVICSAAPTLVSVLNRIELTTTDYTPGIYAAGYIVFALTFVHSSVRMFVRSCVRSFVTFRHVRRIYIKVFG